jgi:hypothetical protein
MIGELLQAIINSTHDTSTFTILKPLQLGKQQRVYKSG